jgi:hypothetical protein
MLTLKPRELPEIAYVAVEQRNPHSEIANIYLPGSSQWFATIYPAPSDEYHVYVCLVTGTPDFDNGFSSTVAGFHVNQLNLDNTLRKLALLIPPM